MATRRTQPHRATGRRRETPALAAMQRGKGPMKSPGDVRRTAMKKRGKKRKKRARYRGPLAQILASRRASKR